MGCFFFLVLEDGVSILLPCHRSKDLRSRTQLHRVEPELSYRSSALEHYIKRKPIHHLTSQFQETEDGQPQKQVQRFQIKVSAPVLTTTHLGKTPAHGGR